MRSLRDGSLAHVCVTCEFDQALAYKPTKIRQSIGNFGGIFVKADGLVVSHDISTVGFPYMYVCMVMDCVGPSAPVTCNALPAACHPREIKVQVG